LLARRVEARLRLRRRVRRVEVGVRLRLRVRRVETGLGRWVRHGLVTTTTLSLAVLPVTSTTLPLAALSGVDVSVLRWVRTLR